MKKNDYESSHYVSIICITIFAITVTIILYAFIQETTSLPYDKNSIISALGTLLSAIGLIAISSLTYLSQKQFSELNIEQQQKSLFQTEFTILLQEHTRLLKETFYDNAQLSEKTKNIVILEITKHFYIANGLCFDCHLQLDINKHNISSQYFILLFRILKKIDSFYKDNLPSAKVYSGIIRVAIPHEVMYLVASNALNPYYKEYKELLMKYNFFEHLPFNKEWLVNMAFPSFSAENQLSEKIDKYMKFFIEEFRDSKINAFGKNIYIEDINNIKPS